MIDIIDPILVISIPDFMTSSWLGGIGNSLHRSAPNTLPENGIHAPPPTPLDSNGFIRVVWLDDGKSRYLFIYLF